MSIKEYIAINNMTVTANTDLNDRVLYVKEQSDCYHLYIQEGFYIEARLSDEDSAE